MLAEELLPLELALASRDAAGIDGDLAGLLADDFQEIGASGRRWTVREVRARLGADAPRPMEIRDFTASELVPGVALTTFRIGPARPSLRSSIWVRNGGRWQIRFHQGTLIPGQAATLSR